LEGSAGLRVMQSRKLGKRGDGRGSVPQSNTLGNFKEKRGCPPWGGGNLVAAVVKTPRNYNMVHIRNEPGGKPIRKISKKKERKDLEDRGSTSKKTEMSRGTSKEGLPRPAKKRSSGKKFPCKKGPFFRKGGGCYARRKVGGERNFGGGEVNLPKEVETGLPFRRGRGSPRKKKNLPRNKFREGRAKRRLKPGICFSTHSWGGPNGTTRGQERVQDSKKGLDRKPGSG